MDYLEFIARVTSHIPDKGQVTVRSNGLGIFSARIGLSLGSVLPVGDPEVVVFEDRAAEGFFRHESPAAVPEAVADDVGCLPAILEHYIGTEHLFPRPRIILYRGKMLT